MPELTDFPKKKYICSKCGYRWTEFCPLKCPNCDSLFGLKEVDDK